MAVRTRIKICGMTGKEEVAAVVAAGVDAVGFIFAGESPRYLQPEKARDIIRRLPPFVDAVGVFVNEEASVVQDIVQYCGLTLVQLHGAETPAYCREMTCRVLKAFRVGPHTTPGELAAYEEVVNGFLLDTFHERMAGGTGRTFDWDLMARLNPPGPVILAGGLTPANVGQAVRELRPFAVDCNSGVEIKPGRKDLDKVRQVVDAVRQADAANAAA
jgi:phosphoribosylanthranilate isomerase